MSFGSSVFRGLYGRLIRPLRSAGVVPIKDVISTVSKHPDRYIDGECVTCNVHRRLLVRLYELLICHILLVEAVGDNYDQP